MTEPSLDPDNSLVTATPLLFAHLLSWWGGACLSRGGRVCPPLCLAVLEGTRWPHLRPDSLPKHPRQPSTPPPPTPLFRLALALQSETMNGLEKWGPRRSGVTPRHVWQERPGPRHRVVTRMLSDKGSDLLQLYND